MDDHRPKIQLDYSSPAVEKKEEDSREKERRVALENYNESTFGEKYPIRAAFLRAVSLPWFCFLLYFVCQGGFIRSGLLGDTASFYNLGMVDRQSIDACTKTLSSDSCCTKTRRVIRVVVQSHSGERAG